MNKTQMIDLVAAKTGLKKKEADAAVNALLSAVGDSLNAGEKVQIFGFGSFDIKKRPARMCNNPKTGSKIKVPAKSVIVFRPAAPLREAVKK